MQKVDDILSAGECAELHACIGCTLKGFWGVMLGDVAWNTVRVETSGPTLDVTSAQVERPVDEQGNSDDFGVVSVRRTTGGELVVPTIDDGARFYPIGREIQAVHLVNNTVQTFVHGLPTWTYASTQAVVFDFADGSWLALDRGAWFSEVIRVSEGRGPRSTYNASQDWEDDPEELPDTHFECSSTLVSV
jgi:hypothetical protein